MKGIHGLILAILLGVAGAVFNFLYLVSRSSEVKMAGFVGIADGKNVKRGQRLTDSHLVRVDIPARDAESLKNFAYSDDARSSLIGQRVCARPDERLAGLAPGHEDPGDRTELRAERAGGDRGAGGRRADRSEKVAVRAGTTG